MLLRWRASFTVWCSRHTAWLASHVSSRAWRWFRFAWSGLLLTFGGLAFARVADAGTWQSAAVAARKLGAPLLLLLLLPGVSLFVKALGWRSLVPARFRPGLGLSYSTFLAAQGVNELGFAVLGEPLKVLVLPRDGRAAGMRAVAVDNAVAFLALLVVLFTFAVCRRPVALLAFALAGMGLFGLGQASLRVPRYLAAFSAHYLGKFWVCVELGLGLHLLGEPALAAAAPLALAWTSAAALGAPVPGQLGVVEAALLHSGTVLGIAAHSLLALALIRRARALLWMALGLLLAVRLINQSKGQVIDVSTSDSGQPTAIARRAAPPESIS